MAYFIRAGPKILNVEAVSIAERRGEMLSVVFFGHETEFTFKGADADRVESAILEYQNMSMEALRRNRVIAAKRLPDE